MTVAVSKLAQIYPALVQHLSGPDREYLASVLTLLRVEAGTRLLTYGESSDSLYLIAEGDVDVRLPAGDGEVSLGQRGAGRWVGELGMIDPGPASATVEAVTDATLWSLSHEGFEAMRNENPCAAARVMEAVSHDVAARLRTCNSVLFRRTDEGLLEIVPTHQAQGGGMARLLHQIKDLFSIGEDAPKGHLEAPPPPEKTYTLESFIDEHPSFGRLSAEDREHLLQACEVKTYPDGHAFIRQGEGRTAVFFILEGLVEVSVERPKDATFAVDRFMEPGEIIGLISLVDRGTRSATCRARGSLKVGMLTLEGANLLMNTRAPISCAFQYALANQLSNDARSLNESLLHAAEGPVEGA